MKKWKTTMRICAVVIAFSLYTADAFAQVPRIEELPAGPAPRALEGGARWLQNSLLAPLLRQSAPPVPPAKGANEQVAPEVRELSDAQQRIGSVVKGSFLEKYGEPTDRDLQQQIWGRLTKNWRAEEAATTHRVSDEAPAEVSSMPVFDPYQQPVDPTQIAVEQLRGSARNLDQAAADLEDAGKYAAADRLRASAQRLRREAREFVASQETSAQQTPAPDAGITR